MRRAEKQLNIDRALNVLDVYVAPLFLLIVGIILIILAFTLTFPEPDSLREIRGHLDSYYFYQTGRGRGDYRTIISLREGPRFWTNAVNKENAESILRGRGVEVRYYIDPISTNVPMDGDAVKSYGLWVEGAQIQSANEAISSDKFAVHFLFPVFGILAIIFAVFIHRRNKAKIQNSQGT